MSDPLPPEDQGPPADDDPAPLSSKERRAEKRRVHDAQRKARAIEKENDKRAKAENKQGKDKKRTDKKKKDKKRK